MYAPTIWEEIDEVELDLDSLEELFSTKKKGRCAWVWRSCAANALWVTRAAAPVQKKVVAKVASQLRWLAQITRAHHTCVS